MRCVYAVAVVVGLTTILNAAPLISPGGIVNSASFAPPLSPGGAIAQGSIFSIFGSELGPATAAQPTAFPLGATLGGVSIKVIQGNTSVDAIPLYASSTLINAIMPSNAPAGKVSVQVTFNTAKSNMAPITVAVNAPGIYTATGAGMGPGILQNFVAADASFPINSSSVTAKPGQVEVLWLTGMGPIKSADNSAPPAGNLPFTTEVWVGGKAATNISYSGRTPCCAGVDEIVFTVPADASSGCFVPVTVRVGGAVSNTVTMAINNNGSQCTDAANPFTAAVTQGKVSGVIGLMRTQRRSNSGTVPDSTSDLALATFQQPNGTGFVFNAAVALPPPGGCSVYSGSGNFAGGTPQFSFPAQVADAGTLSLRTSSAIPFTKVGANGTNYYATAPAATQSALYLNAGTATIIGSGGPHVGPFTATVNIPASLLTWTNRDQISTIDRTQPLTVNWTGTGSPVLEILAWDAPANYSVRIQCVPPASASSFTIPTWILSSLPASRTAVEASRATVTLSGVAPLTSFTAPGLDAGAVINVQAMSKAVSIK